MPTQDEGTSKRWRELHPRCRLHSAVTANGPLLPAVMWGCPGRSYAEEEKPGTEECTGLARLLHLTDTAVFTTRGFLATLRQAGLSAPFPHKHLFAPGAVGVEKGMAAGEPCQRGCWM